MPIVKALVGALIGGCLGAYVADMIGPIRGAIGPWLILLAGLGAGLGARLVCGANRNFMTGVVSAVAAIFGVAVISYMSAAVAMQSSEDMEAPLAVSRDIEASIADEASDPDGESETTESTGEESDPAAGQSSDDATADDEADSADEDADSPDTEASDAAADEGQVDDGIDPADGMAPDEPSYQMPSETLTNNVSNTTNAQRSQQPMMHLIANAVSALLAFMIGSGSSPATSREPEQAS
tara:strand:+ start:266435 stop:267151 length:717 start_codon:yes stop_codon:yes gene_type:complete